MLDFANANGDAVISNVAAVVSLCWGSLRIFQIAASST